MSTAGLYRLLADAVLVIHFGFVSFVVGGLVLIWAGWALRWRWVGNFWFRLAHLLAMGVVLAEALGGVICPLTIWEDKLRWMAGEGLRYQGTFIQHWLHRVMFYSVSNVAITVAYAVFFTLLGASLWLVKPRWPWARKARPSPRQHGPGAGNQDDPAG